MKSCNAILENNQKHGSTWNLHEVYFRDPFDRRNCESIDMCEYHYNDVMKVMNERVVDFARKRDNLISERNRERATAKEYDTYYLDIKQPKIEDLRKLVRKMMNNECRNIFCLQDLTKLDKDKKIYTVHTFRPSGKRHYTFNFCSIKCFNGMKGRCGIRMMIQNKQRTLQ